ncbi:hypothetical protein [Catellatospora paridis]|uniref:hypothetical protein n=1 Tax=Catellatospora paridis TaxID=1617086 RepID=UPI0012D41E77|nr:hypothetical protein [Catellatospora paridis]
MSLWEVLADVEREQWTFMPSVGVGPLRFGMSHDEAAVVMDWFAVVVDGTFRERDDTRKAEFRSVRDRPSVQPAVTAYYSRVEGLYCVVVDARCGPQVTLDGLRLVGRVPSEWEADFLAYALPRGIAPRYAPEGDLAPEELGLLIRVQRAGDVVLTRPVFGIVRERAHTLWDSLPYDEFQVH